MKYRINSKKEYHQTMIEVYDLMNKGEKNLNAKELAALSVMAEAAEKYENEVLGLHPISQPETIIQMVEKKMFEKKFTQSSLAETLGLSKSKVSEILTGKRKPDLPFLKGVYKVLGVDATFILEHC